MIYFFHRTQVTIGNSRTRLQIKLKSQVKQLGTFLCRSEWYNTKKSHLLYLNQSSAKIPAPFSVIFKSSMMNEVIKMNENLITEIEINHFKCFENFKTNGFKRVNLIVGKNNVGKTALMEAC
jgi:hypothetical protein